LLTDLTASKTVSSVVHQSQEPSSREDLVASTSPMVVFMSAPSSISGAVSGVADERADAGRHVAAGAVRYAGRREDPPQRRQRGSACHSHGLPDEQMEKWVKRQDTGRAMDVRTQPRSGARERV